MNATVKATYSNGTLTPLTPLNLEEGEEVTVTVHKPTPASGETPTINNAFYEAGKSLSHIAKKEDGPPCGARDYERHLRERAVESFRQRTRWVGSAHLSLRKRYSPLAMKGTVYEWSGCRCVSCHGVALSTMRMNHAQTKSLERLAEEGALAPRLLNLETRNTLLVAERPWATFRRSCR